MLSKNTPTLRFGILLQPLLGQTQISNRKVDHPSAGPWFDEHQCICVRQNLGQTQIPNRKVDHPSAGLCLFEHLCIFDQQTLAKRSTQIVQLTSLWQGYGLRRLIWIYYRCSSTVDKHS